VHVEVGCVRVGCVEVGRVGVHGVCGGGCMGCVEVGWEVDSRGKVAWSINWRRILSPSRVLHSTET